MVLGGTAKTGTFLPHYYSPKKRAAYLADVLVFSAHVSLLPITHRISKGYDGAGRRVH